MKRTPLRAHHSIRRIGVVGRANLEARKAIGEMAEKMKLKECEIGLEGCLKTWPLAPAHRHKRAWYRGNGALLADPKQWLCACQHCHDLIEHNPDLTEEIFIRLRGEE